MSPYPQPTSFLLSLPLLPPPAHRNRHVNPRALLIAVALSVSSAGGLRQKRLADIRTTERGRGGRGRVFVTVEVALLQSVHSCHISPVCRLVLLIIRNFSVHLSLPTFFPRMCPGPPNKLRYRIGQGAVTVLAPRNLSWLVDFWNVCAPRYRALFYSVPEDGIFFSQQSDIGRDIP